MIEWLLIILFLLAYYLLMKHVLPRLGVPT